MIAKLLSSGFVDLVDASVASPGMEGAKGLPSMKLCELNAMPLGDLKKLMREVREPSRFMMVVTASAPHVLI